MTLVLLGGAAALPAVAASSATSLASESIGASVGSLSGSIQQSSASSSKTNRVADGDYRLIEVAAVADRPGMLRMTLQPVADAKPGDGFFLFVPAEVVQQTHLVAGDTVAARQRPYGVEFAQGQPRQAFFLVLADQWLRELQTTPVAL